MILPASARYLVLQPKAALPSYGPVATAAPPPSEETIMIKYDDVAFTVNVLFMFFL
jgi:hypothetical protein